MEGPSARLSGDDFTRRAIRHEGMVYEGMMDELIWAVRLIRSVHAGRTS